MASTYNGSVANLVDPLTTSPLNSPSHAGQHTEINDALQTLGVWTSFTPTWTNLTAGNATQSFAYSEFNKVMVVRGKLTFGSTTSMGTLPEFVIPNSGSAVNQTLGMAVYLDSGTDNYTGLCRADGTKIYLQSNYTGGTWGTMGNLTATAPFTWAINDVIWLSVVIQLS
jgi:hypothetical protein